MEKLGRLLDNFDDNKAKQVLANILESQRMVAGSQAILNEASKDLESLGLSNLSQKLNEGKVDEVTSELSAQVGEVNESVRVRLDEDDFRTLVSGGVVDNSGAKIILADIGWDLMIQIIQEAKAKG